MNKHAVIDFDRITIEAGKRSGQACVRGMRITVADVLDSLAAGMSHQDIMNEFPELVAEDIQACLAFAARSQRRILLA